MTSSDRPEVVLVRHGETEWTRTGQHTSRTDIALTDRGRLQARGLGDVLRERRFVAVLTSPLRRATETAALAGYADGRLVEDLVEWDYGEYEGRTTADIRRDVGDWTVWTHPSPGGESPEAVGARADRVLADARAANGDVVVFGHGHTLRVLAARWCGLPAVDGRLLALDPATISVLGYERETSVIRAWNQSYPAPDADPGGAEPRGRG